MIVVAKMIFGDAIHIPNGPPPEVTVWLRPLMTLVGWLIAGESRTGFFAGWGLLQREAWARTVALVVGFVALLNVPLGTALGIYTLWVLLPVAIRRRVQSDTGPGRVSATNLRPLYELRYGRVV